MRRSFAKMVSLLAAAAALVGLCGCGRAMQMVRHKQSYVPGQQEGIFDRPNPYRAGREFHEPTPEGFCFSIHPTERTYPILLRYGGKVSTNGVWVRDAETGEVEAWVENGCPDGQNDNCQHRLFSLDGALLMDWNENYPYSLLGRWLFVQDREHDPRDGWAVNLDTGEVRFEHYALAEPLSAEGVHSLWLLPNAAFSRGERPGAGVVLVNRELEVLRQFGQEDGLAVSADPLSPGSYILQNPGGNRLYEAALDQFYPGSFEGFVKGEEPMALFSSQKGWAVYRLNPFERVSEFDTGSSPRRYKVYTPAVQIYEQEADLWRGRTCECFLVHPGGTLACDDADWTATGFYAVRGSHLCLFDAQGVQTGLWEVGDFWIGSHPGPYWEPPELTVFSWPGGWEARSRQGGCLRGLGECGEVRLLEEDRYRLLIYKDGKETYSLVDTAGRLLLHDVDRVYATGAPGFWEIRKGMRAGIVDKAGFWCWEIHLENFNDYAAKEG